ncbi:MAG: arginine--tRNA ligase [bacterium]
MIQDSLGRCLGPEDLASLEDVRWVVEIPKRPDHGDFATNAALVLASKVGKKPMELAQLLAESLQDPRGYIQRAQAVPPGFINLFLNRKKVLDVLGLILEQGRDYGRLQTGTRTRVLVEFVSANPTGPLHIGHGRGAALGDALSKVLEAAGFDVSREYYVNDVGRQMEILGRSLYLRYLQELGSEIDFPDDHYRGEYMVELAREFKAIHGEKWAQVEEAQALPAFTEFASKRILEGIREDLEDFRVGYDRWFHESELYSRGEVARYLEGLRSKGLVYEQDEALWFKSSDFGDEKDRVVVRRDGRTTYLASDIAYHADKLDRGFDRLIDIWGADHHGYVPRMKGVIKALGRDPSCLDVILVQMVNLVRNGVPVAMSTRAGEFTTLREVMDEVGVDAARYIFLTRTPDSHLDFDLELAKKQEKENPVYYVQYAHARICSILREAAERGIEPPMPAEARLELLDLPEEWELVKHLVGYPDLIKQAALSLEPHRITYFLDSLASDFHSYYNRGWIDSRARVICSEPELTGARLVLVQAVRQVLANALELLGVSAPEQM